MFDHKREVNKPGSFFLEIVFVYSMRLTSILSEKIILLNLVFVIDRGGGGGEVVSYTIKSNSF